MTRPSAEFYDAHPDAPDWSEAQADLIAGLEHLATTDPKHADYWTQRADDARAQMRARREQAGRRKP